MKDCRVLVVEDDRDLREVIAEILEAEGFPVERAANGHEALEKLRGGYEADVILTNLLMPVVDGYELRAELKKHPGWSRIPLIVPSEGAKVLIVKFNDFQCPACGHSYLSYKPILAKYEAQYPGAVRMVLKDYPLNPTCNSASTPAYG